MSNLNCSIKFTKIIGDCKTSILNQLKAHKYVDEQRKIMNMADYLSYEKRTNEKASKKLGRPVELIYTNKNSDVLVKYNTKTVFFNYDVAEEIDRLNIEEQFTKETFDPNIEENIITSEGDYMPNYEPPVYQDNVEKELQQAQKDLDKEMITILEKDKQMESKEDERPLEEKSKQLEFDFNPTPSLETIWTSNQEKLISKFPEITYEDFVSLSNEERDNLLTCL